MYWMNVDFPTNTCTLHHKDCSYVHKETSYKAHDDLARDGGWLEFGALSHAETMHKKKFGRMKLKRCGKCMKEEESYPTGMLIVERLSREEIKKRYGKVDI